MTRLADLGHRLELDVNVSTTQASSPDFPLWVPQTLAHAQFPASLLGLKIAETVLMRHHTLTKQNLSELAVEQVIFGDDGSPASVVRGDLRAHESMVMTDVWSGPRAGHLVRGDVLVIRLPRQGAERSRAAVSELGTRVANAGLGACQPSTSPSQTRSRDRA
jgi:hypothetical protein